MFSLYCIHKHISSLYQNWMGGVWNGIPLRLYTLNFTVSACCPVFFYLEKQVERFWWLWGHRDIHIHHSRCLYEFRLWQYRQHLHSQATQSLAWRRGAEHNVPSQPRCYSQFIAAQRGKISFFFLLWHCLHQPHSRTSSTPRSNWPAQCIPLFVYQFFVSFCLVFWEKEHELGG